MCGEQIGVIRLLINIQGSPPRVRGTEPPSASIEYRVRITPACAGNSFMFAMVTGAVKDHPRVCGEQKEPSISDALLVGSPPRVRGTVDELISRYRGEGITPACAGNRFRSRCLHPHFWDHPRVCGEQLPGGHGRMRGIGSPPRVRGTAVSASVRARRLGITPACAGNRLLSLQKAVVFWDHPRVCGEQFATSLCKKALEGSPPRVRGTGRPMS